MPAEAAVAIEGLAFAYPGREVFRGFDLYLAAGEHLALLGASGCGKTTLLHLIAGLLQPQAGRLRCGGQPCVGPGIDRALVFQDLALFPWYTALGNVAYALARRGVPRRERREQAAAMLARLGVEVQEMHRHPHRLSGGQRQRVALARALIARPRVLLLDEASAALDAATALRLQRELRRLQAEDGFACISVSHRIEEAVEGADRCLLLAGNPASIACVYDLHADGRAAAAVHIRASIHHHASESSCVTSLSSSS